MKEVWKFTLHIDTRELSLPKDSEILCVKMQYGEPRLWALVDPDLVDQQETRKLWITGTGHPLPDEFEYKYIDTFLLEEGVLVFHVFEITKTLAIGM